MASFFPLGAGTGNTREPSTTTHPQQHQTTSTNEAINPWGNPSVVRYRNEEIYQKGFEIWQQYVQVHHHHHTPAATGSAYNLGDFSVSGGLGPTMRSYSTSSRGMRSGSAGGGINCQDCGNQAKKDCAHLRCRTCCKSRGFECATHVKSTWVPAAKRRERLQQLASMQQQQGNNNPNQSEILTTRMLQRKEAVKGGGGGLVTMNRLAATSSSAGLEMGPNLPAEVTTTALFKCVRVTPIDDSDEHLAYQTAVSIAGRVFKGILYNQGPENRYNSVSANEIPRGAGSLQQHNLLTGIGIKPSEEPVVEASVAGVSGLQLDGTGAAAGTFSTPINPLLAGTQLFPPPRSSPIVRSCQEVPAHSLNFFPFCFWI
ncbi:SHI RELATED SEQUENCE 5-like protein [Drosera capensis]